MKSYQRFFPKYILLFIICSLVLLGCTNDIEQYNMEYNLRGTNIKEKVGELLYYVVSEYDENKKMYIDKLHKTSVLPERSALVLIDVWRDSFLDSITIKHINPLIEEFSAKGAKVIYAPSQGLENKNLIMLEEGIHFHNLDTMDSYLKENNIENLFYVGFDTFYCVLDKPNGIFNVKKRNEDIQVFLLEEGVLSYTREMMITSIALLKKNSIGIIPYNSQNKVFPLQTIADVEAKTKNIVPPGNQFVLLFENMDENKALEDFREELDKMEVDYGIVKKDKLYFEGNEIKPKDFWKFLRYQGIQNLYYAGSYLNNEILWSDYGVLPLFIKVIHQSAKGLPWPYIINDLAFMTPTESIEPEFEKATILNHYRMIHNINSETLLNNWKETQNKISIPGIKHDPEFL